MSQKTREELKEIFITSAKPLEIDFHDWLDSYVHQSDNLEISNIDGLEASLTDISSQVSAANANSSALSAHIGNLANPHQTSLQQVLSTDNKTTAGTNSKAPIVLQPGTLLVTPQNGAIEKDSRSTYITDAEGLRIDLLAPHRGVHKLYGWGDITVGQTLNWQLPLGGDQYSWNLTGDGTATISTAFQFWNYTGRVKVEYYLQNTLISRFVVTSYPQDTVWAGFMTMDIKLQKRLSNPYWLFNGPDAIFDGHGGVLTETSRLTGLVADNSNIAMPQLVVKITDADNPGQTGGSIGRMESLTLCINKPIAGSWQ
ncbi:hypothetical protein [Taibaiella soli]|uniref:Uncharacterized protein n=1 Tax=Taibaiella soli TaxID=1649169 RepID=A0A2W2B1M4_9BACT|nr:hypothetical protein [Taibaiella soli]PZF73908.1 hypothetical protein DN068_06080 [Taibaiella soli]